MNFKTLGMLNRECVNMNNNVKEGISKRGEHYYFPLTKFNTFYSHLVPPNAIEMFLNKTLCNIHNANIHVDMEHPHIPYLLVEHKGNIFTLEYIYYDKELDRLKISGAILDSNYKKLVEKIRDLSAYLDLENLIDINLLFKREVY